MSWNLHITTTGYYLCRVCALDENCDSPLLKYCVAHWTASWSGLTWHHKILDPSVCGQCIPRWADALGSHLVAVLMQDAKNILQNHCYLQNDWNIIWAYILLSEGSKNYGITKSLHLHALWSSQQFSYLEWTSFIMMSTNPFYWLYQSNK
jgi:hypothetical protein